MKQTILAVALMFACTVNAPARQDHAHEQSSTAAVQPMTGLGSHHHEITTRVPEAQQLFDQGLVLVYGFNHGQAIRLFLRAAELDPDAPMPLWGIALAYGPNINDFEMDPQRAKTADEYVTKAQSVAAAHGTDVERAYIRALSTRYSSDASADLHTLQVQYKDAMAALAKRYPDDLDAQTLYAESLMDLRPWQLWTPDGRPSDVTNEVVRVLESVLKRDPLHPGANHYYIHTMEASPDPGKALASAKRLETLVPAAGHLVHMPAHIYARTGQFGASADSNAAAAAIDEGFIQQTNTRGGMYPLMYYNHNVHFESYAASMAGQFARASRTAEKLAGNVTPFVPDMPMLEAFLPQRYFVLLRFARWDDVLAIPAPSDTLELTKIVSHYARAYAFASKGDAGGARGEQHLFITKASMVRPDTPIGTLNPAAQLFDVMRPLLEGRIAAAVGDRASAILKYRAAVAAEDALAYDEPPTWYYPVRETLGAALLADGKASEAEQVFRDDLKRNRGNGRSLFGLWKSLEAEKKTADAGRARTDFEQAWAAADVTLKLEDF